MNIYILDINKVSIRKALNLIRINIIENKNI